MQTKNKFCTLLLLMLATALPSAAPAQPAPKDAVSTIADYVIGPGDSIQIFVWRNPELSVTVPVRPDGKISTPLVENMVAIGKTPSQLARDIEKVLAEYVKSPQVNVIVGNAVSVFSQVKVIGEVKAPQALPYRKGLRILDVVLATGGLTDFAAANRAKLLRQQNGQSKEIKLRIWDLMNKGALKYNLELEPGETEES